MWFIYIIRCADNSFYTGITNNLERRIREHNTDNTLGAKYTRTRRPVTLVYNEERRTRGLATKRERQIKKLSRSAKEQLCTSLF